MKVIDHNNRAFRSRWGVQNSGVKWNGAFYYSKEIVKNIIPNVKTDRQWLTVNTYSPAEVEDGCIVFIHNNKHPENYDWLRGKKDLILVCGVKSTLKKVKHLGRPIYLPLSVDISYVEQFKVKDKTKEVAFVGRRSKQTENLPDGIDHLMNLPRTKLLPAMAPYKAVYAVGRCAIEAKILGCKVLSYDNRFPNPRIWKVLDNKEAAELLQKALDKIDGKDNGIKQD